MRPVITRSLGSMQDPLITLESARLERSLHRHWLFGNQFGYHWTIWFTLSSPSGDRETLCVPLLLN